MVGRSIPRQFPVVPRLAQGGLRALSLVGGLVVLVCWAAGGARPGGLGGGHCPPDGSVCDEQLPTTPVQVRNTESTKDPQLTTTLTSPLWCSYQQLIASRLSSASISLRSRPNKALAARAPLFGPCLGTHVNPRAHLHLTATVGQPGVCLPPPEASACPGCNLWQDPETRLRRCEKNADDAALNVDP